MAKPVMLLFYDGFELKAREQIGPRVFHAVRCRLRAVFRRLRGKQINTGFYEAFLAIVKGLQRLGFEVRVNDFAAARKDPAYPIGLAGFPEVLEHVQLPNPMIFGPGDPGYPDEAGKLAEHPSTHFIIQPSDWFVEYYRPYCGEKMLCCPVGIDVDVLPDLKNTKKTYDFLIYDKIRWNRPEVVPEVLDRLVRALEERDLNYKVIRYGEHLQKYYFECLTKSNALAFICEHETQGLACEEALAMNIPVLAWDEEKLIDPKQRIFARDDLKVTSVPYFDHRCGRTFKIDNLEQKLDDFILGLPEYAPRDFVRERLSPEATAKVFAEAYQSLICLDRPS